MTSTNQEQSHHPIVPNDFSPEYTPEVQILNFAPVNCDIMLLDTSYLTGKIVRNHLMSTHLIMKQGERYPIVNHVLTEKLPEPMKAFANKLSYDHVPNSITRL